MCIRVYFCNHASLGLFLYRTLHVTPMTSMSAMINDALEETATKNIVRNLTVDTELEPTSVQHRGLEVSRIEKGLKAVSDRKSVV